MTGNGRTGAEPCLGDLPNDLLGDIYRRCSSSYDRARFAAVCKSWRAAASLQPKLPALPLLLPSTGNCCLDQKARAYSPEDGRVLRSQLPWFPYGKHIVGSHEGGWVAVAIGGWIEIMNLFSRAWGLQKGQIVCTCPTARYTTCKMSILKVVFSKDPSLGGCILASMTTTCKIAVCRIHSPGAGWTTRGCGTDTRFVDFAFCKGELYGLSDSLVLYKLVIGINGYNTPVTILFNELTVRWPEVFNPKYIFELRGQLAIAVKVSPIESGKAQIFKVFELASSNTTQSYKYKWVEVTSFADHALFLGPGCCKAVHVSALSRRGEVEGNHIYYYKQKHKLPHGVDPQCLNRLDLGSCAVYCYENQGAYHSESERVISRGYHFGKKCDGTNGRNSCTCILPRQF